MPQDVLLEPDPSAVSDDVGAVGEERIDPTLFRERSMARIMLHCETDQGVAHTQDPTPYVGALGRPMPLRDDRRCEDDSSPHPKLSWGIPGASSKCLSHRLEQILGERAVITIRWNRRFIRSRLDVDSNPVLLKQGRGFRRHAYEQQQRP